MSSLGSNDTLSGEVATLLRSSHYRAIEDSIAAELGQPVVLDPETMAPFAANELRDSGLTIVRIKELIEHVGPLTVRFGVELNRGESTVPDEEEWDPSEGDQQPERSRGPSLGLGMGFGLSYLIYVAFLADGDEARLLRFLNARRIPHASRFAGRLRAYYASARAA